MQKIRSHADTAVRPAHSPDFIYPSRGVCPSKNGGKDFHVKFLPQFGSGICLVYKHDLNAE